MSVTLDLRLQGFNARIGVKHNLVSLCFELLTSLRKVSCHVLLVTTGTEIR